MQAKDYRGAIVVYTQGIEACLQQRKEDGEEEKVAAGAGATGGHNDGKPVFDAVAVAALYGNRAASHVMILGYEQAISDCDSAVALNPKFANAIFRKAMALKKLVRICVGASCLHGMPSTFAVTCLQHDGCTGGRISCSIIVGPLSLPQVVAIEVTTGWWCSPLFYSVYYSISSSCVPLLFFLLQHRPVSGRGVPMA